MKYKQCNFSHGVALTTAWIPSWAAQVGNQVQLKDSEDPNIFWHILHVSSAEREEEEVKAQERMYKQFQHSTRGGGID